MLILLLPYGWFREAVEPLCENPTIAIRVFFMALKMAMAIHFIAVRWQVQNPMFKTVQNVSCYLEDKDKALSLSRLLVI